MPQPQPELATLAALQPGAHAIAAIGPYTNENAESKARVMVAASEPKTLASLVRWARWSAKQEPPFRLHSRQTGVDGNPMMSGEFLRWLKSGEYLDVACAVDPDGYYQMPFRCAVLTMHGRDERTDNAMQADFALAVAMSDEPVDKVAAFMGVKPHWVVEPAAIAALRKLWSLYAPMRPLR